MTLQALRETIGEADFFTLLRTWYAENKYGNVTTADFIATAERVSGDELERVLRRLAVRHDEAAAARRLTRLSRRAPRGAARPPRAAPRARPRAGRAARRAPAPAAGAAAADGAAREAASAGADGGAATSARSSAERVAVALLLLPRPALEPRDELELDELPEHVVHRGQVGEAVHPVRALLELAGRLLAAQHQHGQDRELPGVEPERLVQQVAELVRAARCDRSPAACSAAGRGGAAPRGSSTRRTGRPGRGSSSGCRRAAAR